MRQDWCPLEVHVVELLLLILTGFLLVNGVNGNIMVVANSTFACGSVARAYRSSQRFEKVELTEIDKMQLFAEKGGDFIKLYLAVTDEQANQHFPHLLDDFRVNPAFMASMGGLDRLAVSQAMRKADIKEMMRTIETLKKEERRAQSRGSNNNSNNNNNNNNNADFFPSTSTSTLAPGRDCSPKPVSFPDSLTERVSSDNDPSAHHNVKRDNSADNDLQRTSNFDSSFHRSDHHKVDRKFMDIIRNILERKNNKGNIRKRRSTEDRDSSVYDGILPYVLPESIGMETTLTKNDGSAEIEYCIERGSAANDHYLNMCTTCAVTTRLGDNYWPKLLNEALCSDNDHHCMIMDGVANGRCQQREMPMNLLRKKEGYCSLAKKDGEVVIIDEWEIYPKEIMVGCECTISKNSMLAQFV